MDLRVGVPLLCIGVVVTCWIVWEKLHEGRARRAVVQLVVAASKRLGQLEKRDDGLTLEQFTRHINHEAEWVHAALGHMEARLFVETRRPLPALSLSPPDRVASHLRGLRENLNNLYTRLPSLEVERDFKPSEWKNRL